MEEQQKNEMDAFCAQSRFGCLLLPIKVICLTVLCFILDFSLYYHYHRKNYARAYFFSFGKCNGEQIINLEAKLESRSTQQYYNNTGGQYISRVHLLKY